MDEKVFWKYYPGNPKLIMSFECFKRTTVLFDPGGGLPYETDGDARRLA